MPVIFLHRQEAVGVLHGLHDLAVGQDALTGEPLVDGLPVGVVHVPALLVGIVHSLGQEKVRPDLGVLLQNVVAVAAHHQRDARLGVELQDVLVQHDLLIRVEVEAKRS